MLSLQWRTQDFVSEGSNLWVRDPICHKPYLNFTFISQNSKFILKNTGQGTEVLNIGTRGVESELESESPRVVATSQESESESSSYFHSDSASLITFWSGSGRPKKSVIFREYRHFLISRANIGATMKDSDLEAFRQHTPWLISFNYILQSFDRAS